MRLAEARRRTGYSARGFAKATGSSTRTVWELETGNRLPRPSTVRKFAKALAVGVGDVEEFREAIRKRASRGVPPEVLAQVEQMEVDLVDATVIRVAAERSLREVMKYLSSRERLRWSNASTGRYAAEPSGRKRRTTEKQDVENVAN